LGLKGTILLGAANFAQPAQKKKFLILSHKTKTAVSNNIKGASPLTPILLNAMGNPVIWKQIFSYVPKETQNSIENFNLYFAMTNPSRILTRTTTIPSVQKNKDF